MSTPMQYVKLPIPIDAVQWDGSPEAHTVIVRWCNNADQVYGKDPRTGDLAIGTLEGAMRVDFGSYVIRGVRGEVYPCAKDIFEASYVPAESEDEPAAQTPKSLHDTEADGATKNVRDIRFWGDGDAFRLICKASSEAEGWMKSTKAMPTAGGCVVQVSTQQRNPDGSYAVAEAVTYVPFCDIKEKKDAEGNVVSRNLVQGWPGEAALIDVLRNGPSSTGAGDVPDGEEMVDATPVDASPTVIR